MQLMGTAAGYAFQEWLRARVHSSSKPCFPRVSDEIAAYQAAVREKMAFALGSKPLYTPMQATIHQVHIRSGYTIETVSFPTFSGLVMTATAYIPHTENKVPGVLVVHGHRPHGRRDPHVQYRCLALVHSGYFVLAVDCLGAGERATTLPGAYHGGLEAASLWLLDRSLFGIQVYENMRACDYLISRPEVDSTRLAITGASGGGNQAFYTGAYDERFHAIIPVCSTGSYTQMIGNSNCICETPWGMAASLEQSDIYALMAPRAVLVMSALDDSITFWHEEAKATVETVRPLWKLLNAEDKLAFRAFSTGHGYWSPYRKALLGWLHRWFQHGISDEPLEEPHYEIDDLTTLACFPGAEQPQVMTLRSFYGTHYDHMMAHQKGNVSLTELSQVLKFMPDTEPLRMERLTQIGSPHGLGLIWHRKDGLCVPAFAMWKGYDRPADHIVIWLGDSKSDVQKCPVSNQVLDVGAQVWAVDLPGLGEATLPFENGDARLGLRHNAVRACHMLGITLAGLWIQLLQQLTITARSMGATTVSLVVTGSPATAVLMGIGLLDGIDRILIQKPLASYRYGSAFKHLPMEMMVPNLLCVGDLPTLVALRAPRPLTIAAPVNGKGEPLSVVERESVYSSVRERFNILGDPQAFRLIGEEEAYSGLGCWL